MRDELSAPYAKGNMPQLAEALQQLIKLNPRPRKWANWKAFCRKGAAAARAGKKDSALSSCTSCHKVYRRAYNVAYRERKLGK